MADQEHPAKGIDQSWDRGWDGHRKRQSTTGLALTHAERLRWLEQTMDTMRRWQGRACQAGPSTPPPR